MSRLEWHEIDGWFTEADAEALGKLCDRVVNGGRIIEIGSFCGRSTVFMAHRVQGREVRILAVDNFKGGEPDDPATKRQQKEPTLLEFMANLELAGVSRVVDVMATDSLRAACWLHRDELSQYEDMDCTGLVFIDADHRCEAVERDINIWSRWVEHESGILCGHDALEGPGQVARERFGDRYRQEANVWWVEHG